MSSKRKAVERVKTALITVLTLSALLLGWQTRLFNEFLYSIPVFKGAAGLFKSAPGIIEESNGAKEAARPYCIVVTDGEGGHYGVKYDTDEINTLHVRTSGIFGETLGSGATPVEVDESVWREALVSRGVYFEYMTPINLSVLSSWLGSRVPVPDNGVMLRRMCATFGGDLNRIYFQDERNGLFYVAGAVSSGGRSIDLSMYSDNGAEFSFETGLAAAKKAPYMLLLPESVHPVLRGEAPASQQELLDTILLAFNVSNRIKPSYSAADGALVYVGAQFTVRVEQDGRAVFMRTETVQEDIVVREMGEGEMIERARAIVTDTIALRGSDAELHFESAWFSVNGSYTVTFSYRAVGGFVYVNEDGSAASITFKDGEINAMELNFRSYYITDETVVLPPERQALAAAGAEFILCYRDTGTERLQPFWVKNVARSTG